MPEHPRPDEPDQYLQLTQASLGELRAHAARETSATVLGQVARAVLQIGSTVVLARLLSPDDFGLVAMVLVFVGFLGLFRDFGLTQAVIEDRGLSSSQLNGVFWTAAMANVAVACVTAAMAPMIAWLYDEPRLLLITIALAGVHLVAGLGAVPFAVLTRRMEFRSLVAIEVTGSAIGVLVGILVATLDASYWALVTMQAARELSIAILLWSRTRWLPTRPRSDRDIRHLMVFGWNITRFDVANYVARNSDDLLIGWRWGAGPLGQYGAAYRILRLPLDLLMEPIRRVALPVLIRLRHDPASYRASYVQLTRMVLTMTAPMMAFVMVTSDWLIDILMGPGWTEAGAILRWLALAGLFQPLVNTVGLLFISQGRTRDYARVGITTAAVALMSFFIGLPFGAIGVAASYVIGDIAVRTPIFIRAAGSEGPVSPRDMLGTLAFPSVLAVWAFVASIGTRLLGASLSPLVGFAVAAVATSGGIMLIMVGTATGRSVLGQVKTLVTAVRST